MPGIEFDAAKLKDAIDKDDISEWYEDAFKNYLYLNSTALQNIGTFFGNKQSNFDYLRLRFEKNRDYGYACYYLKNQFNATQYAIQHHKFKALDGLFEKGICTWNEDEIISLIKSKNPQNITAATIFLRHLELNDNKNRYHYLASELNITEVFSYKKQFDFIPALLDLIEKSGEFSGIPENVLELSPKVLLQVMRQIRDFPVQDTNSRKSIVSLLELLVKKNIFAKLNNTYMIEFCDLFHALDVAGSSGNQFISNCLNFYFRPYLHIVLYHFLKDTEKKGGFAYYPDITTYLICAGADLSKLFELHNMHPDSVDYNKIINNTITRRDVVQRIIENANKTLPNRLNKNKVDHLTQLSKEYFTFDLNLEKSHLHTINWRMAYEGERKQLEIIPNPPLFLHHLTTYIFLADMMKFKDSYDLSFSSSCRSICEVLYYFQDAFKNSPTKNAGYVDQANKVANDLLNNDYKYTTIYKNNAKTTLSFLDKVSAKGTCPALVFFGAAYLFNEVKEAKDLRQQRLLGPNVK